MQDTLTGHLRRVFGILFKSADRMSRALTGLTPEEKRDVVAAARACGLMDPSVKDPGLDIESCVITEEIGDYERPEKPGVIDRTIRLQHGDWRPVDIRVRLFDATQAQRRSLAMRVAAILLPGEDVVFVSKDEATRVLQAARR